MRQIFDTGLAGKTDAIFVGQTNLTYLLRREIGDFGVRNRLPTVCALSQWVEAGCLLSCGVDLAAQNRDVAAYVDKVLRGARPADLPVTQPTKFHLAVNLRTAAAIGINVPAAVLQRADLVIE